MKRDLSRDDKNKSSAYNDKLKISENGSQRFEENIFATTLAIRKMIIIMFTAVVKKHTGIWMIIQ